MSQKFSEGVILGYRNVQHMLAHRGLPVLCMDGGSYEAKFKAIVLSCVSQAIEGLVNEELRNRGLRAQGSLDVPLVRALEPEPRE